MEETQQQTVSGLHLAKLISGEFVLGRLMGMNLINVFIVRFNADSMTGSIGTSLSPYMAPLDHSLSHMISLDKAITVTTPNNDLTQKYINAVTQLMARMKQQTPESVPDKEVSDLEKSIENLEATATEEKNPKVTQLHGEKDDGQNDISGETDTTKTEETKE